MSKIDRNHAVVLTADDFIANHFTGSPKNVVFWDTCSLLNIIRFIYREEGVFQDKIDSIIAIHDKVVAGHIYSVTSEVVIDEWNSHVEETLSKLKEDLVLTSGYHEKGIIVANRINNASWTSEPLTGKGIEQKLLKLVKEIIDKTFFLRYDETMAYNALVRTITKRPPAGVKEEFKDCAIWETICELAVKMNNVDSSKTKVFYTVNTADFCQKKSDPPVILYQLSAEAITKSFEVCFTIEDTASRI